MKLKNSEIILPSNKKFGFFFSFVFIILSTFFIFNGSKIISIIFFILALMFFIITLFNADFLTHLNKLWMKLGYLLGIIISPIILGIIFYIFFTFYSLIMRLFKRDELRLKYLNRESYWKKRLYKDNQTNFKNQF